MLRRERELGEARLTGGADDRFNIDAKIRAQDLRLDRDFPDARGREQDLVVARFDRVPHGFRQAPRIRK
jgi:hypothetical protein